MAALYEGKSFPAGKMTLKKCLRQPPAGRVSPEQPVGGIGLRASGSRSGQFHNVRNYFESSRQPKGVSLQAKKS